jgi:hypothetical protein
MKIRSKLLLTIAFLSFSFSFAGTFTVPEWVRNSCVFVMLNDTTAIGSGFLVGIQQDSVTFCYLISAKHVIEPVLKSANNILIRVNRKEKESPQILNLPTLGFNGKRWIEHNNPAIDVAIVPLAIWDKMDLIEVNMFVVTDSTKDYFADSVFLKKFKVSSGDGVFTLGLVPDLFNKDEKNLVLSRFGTVSALPQYNLKLPGGEQKAYFLDCPAFGGNSGGPAYLLLERDENSSLIAGWRIALLGVVTEFVPSPLRMKTVETENAKNIAVQLIENTGISKVVPVDYLKELLYSKDQIEFRKNATRKSK